MKKFIAAFIASLMLATNVYAVDVEAKRIRTNTSGFNNNLSSSDDNVQKSLDTVDNLSITPKTRQLTINGTAYDLTADRTWSVGTVTGSGATNAFMYWASTTAATYLANSVVDATNYILTFFTTQGSEKVTNGTFTGSATGWTVGSGYAYSSNTVVHSSNGTAALQQNAGSLSGELYKLTYTISAWTVGSVTPSMGGITGTAVSANGTYTEYFIATSTANLAFTPTNTARFTIDDVSVKRLSGGGIRIGDVYSNTAMISNSLSNSSPGTTRHLWLKNPSGSYTWIEAMFGSTLRGAIKFDSGGEIGLYSSGGNGTAFYTTGSSLYSYNYTGGFYHQGFGSFGSYVGASGGVNAGQQGAPISTLTSQGGTGFKTTYITTNQTLTNSYTDIDVNGDLNNLCTGTPTACNTYLNSTNCNNHSGVGCTWFSGNSCSVFNYEYGMSSCSGTSGCSPDSSSCSGPGDQWSCESQDDSYGGSCSFVYCSGYGSLEDCTNAGCTPDTSDCGMFDESTCNSYNPQCTTNTSDCVDYQNSGDGCNGSQPGSCSSTSNSCFLYNGTDQGTCEGNGCYWDSGGSNCWEKCVGSYFTSCSGSYFSSCSGDYCTGSYYTGNCSGSYGAECQGSASCSNLTDDGSVACEAESGCDWSTGISLTFPADSGNTSFFRFYRIFNSGASAAATLLPNTGQTVNQTSSFSLTPKDSAIFFLFYHQISCSTWNGTNESTCETGHGTDCNWTACSGDESACNAIGGACFWDGDSCEGVGNCAGTWNVARDWRILADHYDILPRSIGGTGADNTTQTYTPTLTNVTNVSASTARQCTYVRVGNSVTVSGQFDIDPTTTLSATQLDISLPIASNFTTVYQLGGTANATAIAGMSAGIQANSTNDRASVKFNATDVTNQTMTFTFTYEVL